MNGALGSAKGQTAWDRLRDDPHLAESVCAEIAAIEGIKYSKSRIEFSNNLIFVLDEYCVVKVFGSDQRMEYEVESAVLEGSRKMDGVPLPDLISANTYGLDEGWSYIVMEFISGEPFSSVKHQLTAGELRRIGAELGQCLLQFHKCDHSVKNRVQQVGKTWGELCSARLREFLGEIKGFSELPSAVIDEIENFALCTSHEYLDGPNVLAHADLTGDHLILARSGGSWVISGIIDVADAMIAPAGYDWVDLWFWTFERDVDAMKAFMRAYDPTERMQEDFRRSCLAFYLHSYRALGWLRDFYREAGSPPIHSLADLQNLFWPELLQMNVFDS